MISDTYICKTHVFKVVLSLALLNSLRLLKCRKKCKTKFLSYISKNFCYKKIYQILPQFWALSLVGRGALIYCIKV